MREAGGNMLAVNCDALVVTTNGFVKANGECVMGRGIAKQVADLFPKLPKLLGEAIKVHGNKIHHFKFDDDPREIVCFPVKPISKVYDGSNVVRYMARRFKVGQVVAGWACKAEASIIEKSLSELVTLTDDYNWRKVITPQFGCGAGELDWCEVLPLCQQFLDERFTAYHY